MHTKGDGWPKTWEKVEKELNVILWKQLDDLLRTNLQFSSRVEKKETTWRELCLSEGVSESYCIDSMIGNPKIVYYFENNKKKPASLQSFYIGYVLHRILLQFNPHNFGRGLRILEVGPGFGDLAALICREFPVSKYYLVDGPPMNRLQRYYLSRAKQIKKCHFEIPKEPVDLIISCCTLGEMSLEDLTYYIKLFEDVLIPETGLMYLIQAKDDRQVPGPRIGIDNYPFTEGKWDLDIHGIARPHVLVEVYGRTKS